MPFFTYMYTHGVIVMIHGSLNILSVVILHVDRLTI